MSWRIERVPGRPLHHTGDDRLALPLRLSRNGEITADVELLLSLAEAEHLRAALCHALDGRPVQPSAPDCRRSMQTSPSTAHIVGRA